MTPTEKQKKPPEREQTTIRLPIALKERLQQEANDKGISFNAYVLSLIDKGYRASQ